MGGVAAMFMVTLLPGVRELDVPSISNRLAPVVAKHRTDSRRDTGRRRFGGFVRIGGMQQVVEAGGRASAPAAAPAVTVASPELAAIPGIDELAKVVCTPQAALTDAHRGVIRRVIGPVAVRPILSQPRMPHDATPVKLLELASDEVDAPGALVVGDEARQHVLDAWAARMSIDERRSVANADELIDLLDQGPAVSFDDPATRARVQVLAHNSRDPRIGAPEMHFGSGYEIGLMFAPGLGDHGRAFAGEIRLMLVPARRAAFDDAVERAVAGIEHGAASPFPGGTTTEMIVSDATRWHERTYDEKMRLLDAFTAPSDAPMGLNVQSRHQLTAPSEYIHFELADHVARQLDRVGDGSSRVPAGITAQEIFTSTGWKERPAAERARLLDMVADAQGTPVIEGLRTAEGVPLDRILGDGDLAHLRRQAWWQVDEFVDGRRAELPTWIRASDVITSDMPKAKLDRLLRGVAARFGAETPEGASAWLVAVRDQLEEAASPGARPEQVRDIAVQALELVDRNYARVNGELRDGYYGWPDFGEIGRVRATVDLLDSLDQYPVTSPTETLTW